MQFKLALTLMLPALLIFVPSFVEATPVLTRIPTGTVRVVCFTVGINMTLTENFPQSPSVTAAPTAVGEAQILREVDYFSY